MGVTIARMKISLRDLQRKNGETEHEKKCMEISAHYPHFIFVN